MCANRLTSIPVPDGTSFGFPIARGGPFLMARADSQIIPRLLHSVTARLKAENVFAGDGPFKAKRVAG